MMLAALGCLAALAGPAEEPAWDVPATDPEPLLVPVRRPANRVPVATTSGLPLPLPPFGPLPDPIEGRDGLPLPEWRRLDPVWVGIIGVGGVAAAALGYGLVAALGNPTHP